MCNVPPFSTANPAPAIGGGVSAQWTALADLNGDCRLDWLVWNFDDRGSTVALDARIFPNDGEYSPTWSPFGAGFEVTSSNSSFAGAVRDIDRDGDLDIVDAFEIWIGQ